MELNIINTTANSFNEAVGISEERANELSSKLDEMVKKLSNQQVRVCDVFNEIAHFCDNVEELVYCTVNHCNFHAEHGFLFVLSKQ